MYLNGSVIETLNDAPFILYWVESSQLQCLEKRDMEFVGQRGRGGHSLKPNPSPRKGQIKVPYAYAYAYACTFKTRLSTPISSSLTFHLSSLLLIPYGYHYIISLLFLCVGVTFLSHSHFSLSIYVTHSFFNHCYVEDR